MNPSKDGPRRNAAAAAILLLLTGGLLGVLVDRLWLFPPRVEAMPLTAEAMAAHLDLGPAEQARVRALLDSLHAEFAAAVQHGPDSLHTLAGGAHLRLEDALPPETRPRFREWMRDHHGQMMERMYGGLPHDPGSVEGTGEPAVPMGTPAP